MARHGILLWVLCALYSHSLIAQKAIFYKTSRDGKEDSLTTFCDLKFGKAFFSSNSVVLVASDFSHEHRKNPSFETTEIQWGKSALNPLQFQARQVLEKSRFRQLKGKACKDLYVGHDSLSFGIGNTGIHQTWKTGQETLSFSLLGSAKADWSAYFLEITHTPNLLTHEGIAIKGALGTMLITNPKAFGKKGESWQPIRVEYAKHKPGYYLRFSEDLAKYDSIYVDPQLVFSGYSGSITDNWGISSTYDFSGNTILAGIAFDVGFPTSATSFQPYFTGPRGGYTADVVLQKFSADGKRMLASTYLGGSSQDIAHSVVCSPTTGEVIVFGTTGSYDFPNVYGLQRNFKGGPKIDPYGEGYIVYESGSDFFVSRFSPDLRQLVGSTFLGGSQNEGINACEKGYVANYGDEFRGAVEMTAEGNILIGGVTFSSDFPIVGGSQKTYGGNGDGIVACLNASTSSLLGSSFLGGNKLDFVNHVSISASGKVGFSGGTLSANFPATSQSYQPIKAPTTFGNLDGMDGFVGVFSSSKLSTFNYVTYIGSSQYDQAFFTAFDKSERLYTLGQTKGSIPFLTKSLYGYPLGGLFIQRYSYAGDALELSFRFGSKANSPNLSPTALSIDGCDQIYLAGWGGFIENSCSYLVTGTNGLPVTKDALQSFTDDQDFYVCVLNPEAAGLKYASYFGGNGFRPEHVDGGTSRFDPKGYIYEAVCAGCGGNSTFPTTPGVYSATNNSNNCNMAAFKISLIPLATPLSASLAPPVICENSSITLTHNARPQPGAGINFGDGTILKPPTSPSMHTYGSPGTYAIKVYGQASDCTPFDTTKIEVLVKPKPKASRDTTLRFCPGDSVVVQLSDTGGQIRWVPKTYLNVDTGTKVIAGPPSSILYSAILFNKEGCADTTRVQVNSKGDFRSPIVKTKVDSCQSLSYLTLNYPYPLGNLVWKVDDQSYYTPLVIIPFSKPFAGFAELTGISNGCTYDSLVPVRLANYKASINFQLVIDSAQTSCLGLEHRYTALSNQRLAQRWLLDHQLLDISDHFVAGEEYQGKRLTLVVYNGNCTDTAYVQVPIVKVSIPNIVTKNGDGHNDTFQPIHLPETSELSIFNRWGKPIAENLQAIKGYDFPDEVPGVYFYEISAPNGLACRGWVELVK